MPKDVYDLTDLRDWQAVTAEGQPPIRVAVFGDPVAHSASPPMHNAALEALGIPSRYARVQVKPDELAEALQLLRAGNFVGVNLTIPHKAAAPGLIDEVDEHAQTLGAVNTISVDGQRLRGFNTDGPGFVRAIRADFSVDVRDLRIMILGAGGGAGRGIAVQCALERCERLVLVNRTFAKGALLRDELSSRMSGPELLGPVERLEAVPWERDAIQRQLENVDLLVNATSVGMKFSDPPLLPGVLLPPHLLVYDTVYSSGRTRLLQNAAEAGARGANGLSMLLHQGALSFEIWFGREAPLDVMRTALNDAVG